MLELPWEEGSLLGGSGSSPAPATDAPPPPAGGWGTRPLVALDLETTGRDPRQDRILGVALYRQEPGGEPEPLVDTLVDPGAEVVIPAEAAAVHGITRERLETVDAPPLTGILPAVHDALVDCATQGTGVVIYNAPFDWPFLAAELARLAPPRWLPNCRLVDPLVLDRHVDRFRKGKRTLETACQVYDATLDQAHDAGADARACLQVARAIGKRYPEVGGLSLDELVELQTRAHSEWREGFNAYLRRIGADRDPIAGEWPGLPDDLEVVDVAADRRAAPAQPRVPEPASTSAR